MANMREIRSRIKSVKSTQQITKAMKMVAVSKLRRTQAGMEAMRPFAEKSQEIMDTLLEDSSGLENDYIKPRKAIEKVCYVMFVGNRGLCGVYNSALMHFMSAIAAEETHEVSLVIIGRWGKDVIANSSLPVIQSFSEASDTPTAEEALEIAEYLKELYRHGEADEIQLVYQHYITALRQEPCVSRLLPAKPGGASGSSSAGLVFDFVPDSASVLHAVMELYINNKVYATMLEARCGEHSARMTAMTSAADSTKTLIADLELSLNRARQAAITTEITEIVGGASALKRKK